MNHIKRVVVVGTSHHNTYGMVRCFGESGIKPDLILYGTTKSYILRSKLVGNCRLVLDAIEAIKCLKEHYDNAVIIACTDEVASLMDKEYETLKDSFVCFNCGSEGRLTECMDKIFQSSLAKDVGLDVPKSVKGTPEEISNTELPIPCIIKPLESIHGGKNLHVCHSNNDLPIALKAFDKDTNLIVQEFIEKDYEIVIVGMSIDNQVFTPAYIQKIRDTKGGTTFATVNDISSLPTNITSKCKSLVTRMAYKGLFGIELLKKGDKYYFVEVNLRNDATTYAVCVAGCNLPMAYWKLSNHDNADAILSNPINQINSIVEFNDFVHVLKRQVSLKAWIKQKKTAKCNYCFSPVDKEPYTVQKHDFIRFLFKTLYAHAFKR